MRCLMAVVCLLLTGAAYGAEDFILYEAEDLVVTAGRTARDSLGIPARVSVISREDLDNSAAQSIAGILRHHSGIIFKSLTATPASAEIAMRGYGENSHGRVLVLVDGRPLNRPDMAGINWLQIPVMNVERIEILHGSQTSLHGNHAVGGLVNIITRHATTKAGAEIEAEAGSDGYHAQRAQINSGNTALGINAYADRMESDGYRSRSAFDSFTAGLSVSANPVEDISITGSFDWSSIDYQLPGGLTRAQISSSRRQSVNPADSGSDLYWNSRIAIAANPRENHAADLSFSFGRKEIETDFASFMSFSDMTIDTWSIAPRYIWDSFIGGHNNRLIAGMDFGFDSLKLDRFLDKTRGSSKTGQADVDRDIIGGYLRNEYNITDGLILGIGGRVESAAYSAEVSTEGAITVNDDHTHHVNAYAISLQQMLGGKSKLFARAEKIYRYPFTDEQISYQGFGDQFYNQLDPEEGWSAEAGADVELTDKVRAGATLFLQEMQDEIAFNAATFENENMDDTRRYGIEAHFAWLLSSRCRLRADYTFIDTEIINGSDKGNSIPLVPEQKVSAEVLLKLPGRINLYAVSTYTGESYLGGDTANSAEKLADYTIVDVAARYRPETYQNLELFAAVDNLFNEKYNTTGFMGWENEALYPAAGTSIRGGIKYRF